MDTSKFQNTRSISFQIKGHLSWCAHIQNRQLLSSYSRLSMTSWSMCYEIPIFRISFKLLTGGGGRNGAGGGAGAGIRLDRSAGGIRTYVLHIGH